MNIYIQGFDLERPMSWQAFNRLPVSKQIEYLEYLREVIGATNAMIAEMFGCEQSTVAYRGRTLGLPGVRNQGHRPSRKQVESWERFINRPVRKQAPEICAEKVSWMTK